MSSKKKKKKVLYSANKISNHSLCHTFRSEDNSSSISHHRFPVEDPHKLGLTLTPPLLLVLGTYGGWRETGLTFMDDGLLPILL